MSKNHYFSNKFLKSLSPRGSPNPTPLNLRYWWPKVTRFGQIAVFKRIMTKST